MSASNKPQPASVVVPGNHDGVHRGHRALLVEARAQAEQHGGLDVTALFFDPHPLRVLAPDRAPARLTTPERRRELLQRAGADRVVVQRFDEPFSRLSPEQFARDVLAAANGAQCVVVGPDFRFGHRRAGDVDTLRSLGRVHGFEVRVVDPLLDEGEPVSSSRIRNVLSRGDVATAAHLLARAHEVDGRVITGDRRGRTLGYPTANLECDDVLAPADGVYAVAVRLLDAPDRPIAGAASLGLRPTFAGAGRSVEVYLLDFDGDLYGRRLRMGFIERLRAEETFDRVEALKARMAQDVHEARQAFDRVDQELLAWM